KGLLAFGYLGRARAAKPKIEADDGTDEETTDGDLLMAHDKLTEEEESQTPSVIAPEADLLTETEKPVTPVQEPTLDVTSTEPLPPLDMRLVLGLPLVVAGVLMALVWAVLRGGV
ncbi:MAG: hypothetical protein ACR2NU_08195, partial [Aeoliella sp.]